MNQAYEVDTLTLNNQFKCLVQQRTRITIETNEVENINAETNTEKVGDKINVYQNKNKIPNGENIRPNSCITKNY